MHTEASLTPTCIQERERALDWITALSPILLMAFCYYRWAAVLLALPAVAGYLAVAALLQWGGVGRCSVAPGAAAGLLTALFLPATAPLWLAAVAGGVAALFAAVPLLAARWLPRVRLVLPPALMGYLLVRFVFPAHVQAYTLPVLWASADALPVASNLNPLTHPAIYSVAHALLGIREAAVGEGCIPVLLLAAGYLLLRRRLRLVAPGAMLLTVTLLSWIVWGLPLHGLLAGSTVLAALVLADREYAPVTYGAQALAGVLAGGAAVLLRALVGEDGCAVGVVLACLLSPLYPPVLALCRRGAVWLWGVLRRYVPPLARRLWRGMVWLARKLHGWIGAIFAKSKNKC